MRAIRSPWINVDNCNEYQPRCRVEVSTKETSVMMKVISKCCFIYLNWFIALFEVFDKCMLGTLVVLNVTGGKIKTVIK